MIGLHQGPRVHPATAAVVLVCYLSACTAWHTQSATPREVMTTQRERVRIVRQDGSRVDLLQPVIYNDSVVGRDASARGMVDSLKPRVAIALADVGAVELHGIDAPRTILLVGAVGVLIAVAAAFYNPGLGWNSSDTSIHSSPLVYSWAGHAWQLESGTYAGAIAPGVAGTDVTLLEHATVAAGELALQVRNELSETDHLDAVALLAVDHPPGTAVAPSADGNVHLINGLVHAVQARDFADRDVAQILASRDGRSWESQLQPRDTADPRALSDGVELVFPRPPEARSARLVVDARNTSWVPLMLGRIVAMHGRATRAWYDSLGAYPDAARQYTQLLAREGALRVLIGEGERWVQQGMVSAPGPEVTKRQVVPLDLSGVRESVVRVRLESTPSLWLIDHVTVDFSPEPALVVRSFAPVSARTVEGRDVRGLVAAPDGHEWVFETRTYADVRFRVPEPTQGMTRTYLIKTTGWYLIHTLEAGAPDVATLDRVLREPRAAARVSVTAINEALRAATSRESPDHSPLPPK